MKAAFSPVICSFKMAALKKLQIEFPLSFPVHEINGENLHLLPGCIDDQVHFREPGLTHKATIYTESRAAVAGGITSFMEMPNTMPPAFTQELLEEKYAIAKHSSLANYSFYMGTSNGNSEEALKTNEKKNEICGIKIFMGSSTGNLLVDNYLTLDKLFAESEVLIATHCESERIIRENLLAFRVPERELTAADHPLIRNVEACFESSLTAVQFAKKHGSRLHIFHLSTEKELSLFTNMIPLGRKTNNCRSMCAPSAFYVRGLCPAWATKSNATRPSKHMETGTYSGKPCWMTGWT